MDLTSKVWNAVLCAKGSAIPKAVRSRGRGEGGRVEGGTRDVAELTIFADGASLADLTTRANMFLCMCMYAKVWIRLIRSARRMRRWQSRIPAVVRAAETRPQKPNDHIIRDRSSNADAVVFYTTYFFCFFFFFLLLFLFPACCCMQYI